MCVATQKVYGRRATLGHCSELVFCSLLLEALEPRPYEPARTGCPVLPVIRRNVLLGPAAHCRALAAGVLASLQLDLKDAREDGERRIKRFVCKSLGSKCGEINPEEAQRSAWVQDVLRFLPKDKVGQVVAGVTGRVFVLAGHKDGIAETGCRIGHALGRLMNLSDALDDYFSDLKARKPNALPRARGLPDDVEAEEMLHSALDELDDLVASLPLRRNADLLFSLINVHARARVETSLANFRRRLARSRPPSPKASGRPNGPAAPASCRRSAASSNRAVAASLSGEPDKGGC